jgi:hypothetical protein
MVIMNRATAALDAVSGGGDEATKGIDEKKAQEVTTPSIAYPPLTIM